MAIRLTNEEFIEKVVNLVGDEYTFLDEYINSRIKIKIIHNTCGYEYIIKPNRFLTGDRCPKCSGRMKKTHQEFINEIKSLVGTEYTFFGVYKNTNTPLLVRHNVCKYEYKVTPNHFIQGRRCPKCSGKMKKSNEEFLKEIKNLVGDEYTFLDKYVNWNTKLKVIHNECGHEYMVSPDGFLNVNNRCPKCANKYGRGSLFKKTNKKFIQEVKDLVGDEYTFLDRYIDCKTPLKVIHNKCKHEYFINPPNFLYNGNRCPKCSLSGISRSEKSLLKFIKKIYSNKIIENDRKIMGNKKEIDIYLPDLKIGIEFCGLYWHSEKYLDKNYHLEKLHKCYKKGIRLIQIFEDEWNNSKKILKSKIKHILGLNSSKESIYARKCTIKEIDSKSKNEFLDEYHIQGKDSSNIKLGLFYNETLVSVMTFSKPRSCLGQKNRDNNSFELSRFATKRRYNVVGGFSKLLSYFKKNYEFSSITTYADLRYSSFEGNLYEVNGFRLSHQSKPNYWYFKYNNSLMKFHRFNFRKGNLKKLFPEIYDDNLSEHEIMLKAKYLRIYDCGCLVYKLIK